MSPVHFIKLDLLDAKEKLLSSNFYWRAQPEHPDDFTALNKMPAVKLEATGASADADGRRTVTVTLHNPTKNIALMAHVQLRREKSGERVLPVYYSDNYVSLVGGETRTIKVEADMSQFKDEDALVVVDGWNVTVEPATGNGRARGNECGSAAGTLAGDGAAIPD